MNILITGKNSYIGNNFERILSYNKLNYQITTLDMRNDDWKLKSFSHYDVILHVAGLVHVKVKNKEDYFKVNTMLTYEVAKKAKLEGVSQFVFLSTMAVFGFNSGIINSKTRINPKTYYAKSKYEAEKLIESLSSDNFCVSVIRPPITYGKNCSGNYLKFSQFVKKTPIYPRIKSERSMIFVDNLIYFIKYIIDNCIPGIFHPQNKEYVNMNQLVSDICLHANRNIKFISFLNPIVKLFTIISSRAQKIFCDLKYDYELIGGPNSTRFQDLYSTTFIDYEKSIELTELQ
jgi:UDP-glucose 4-epimerase